MANSDRRVKTLQIVMYEHRKAVANVANHTECNKIKENLFLFTIFNMLHSAAIATSHIHFLAKCNVAISSGCCIGMRTD
jgi:hypothetical protein